MNLNYKASNIAKAEAKYGLKFFTVLGQIKADNGVPEFGMSDIMFLWACGGGSEDEFDKAIEDDMQQMMNDIVAGIGNAGFLQAKNKALAEVRSQ